MKHFLLFLGILSLFVSGCVSFPDVPPSHINTESTITAWKSHRTSPLIFTANTWTDITWEEVVEEESLKGINYLNNGTIDEDRSILVISNFDDIFTVQGCIHTLWNGPSGTSVGIATRIVSSIDNGTTWEESRCLQTYDFSDRGNAAEGTHPYSGTLSVNQTTWLKLQVQVTDNRLVLNAHPIFDKPVSATIYMSNIGARR